MEKWKSDFYVKYTSHFGSIIGAESYKVFEPYGKYIIRRCFPTDTSATILDLGCGIGGFIRVFSNAGYTNIQGVDVSEESVQYAHQQGLKQVRQGDIWETLIHTANQTYDIILLLDVLEHFPRPEVLQIMAEVHRVLRPQGCVIIHVPNAEGLFGSKIRYSDITHELAFTEKALVQVGRYAGFTSFSCYEDKPIIHSPISFVRRFIWELSTIGYRILHGAESGVLSVKLSQNILFKAVRS